MNPSTLFLSVLLLASSFTSQIAVAQDAQQDLSPLTVAPEFSPIPVEGCKTGAGLVVRLHYDGAKPLRGYLIRVDLKDSSTGETLERLNLEEIRDSQEPITTGAEWSRTLCTALQKIPENTVKASLSVDVLKFADRSIWGPLDLRESHQLVGTIDGMDFSAESTQLERYVSPISPERGPLPVAQVEVKTIGPLQIQSGVWLNEKGQEMLAMGITNESDLPIRGYLITTSFFDPATGARIRRFSTKQLETRGDPANFLMPASTWVADPHRFSYLPDGNLASYELKVDFVIFADGSTFGPKKSQESDEVLGIIHGIDRAKKAAQEIEPSH